MDFLFYITKSACILTLFYTVYIFALKKDTFFTTNRVFLLSGLICALLLPLVTIAKVTFIEAQPVVANASFSEIIPTKTTAFQPVEHTITIWELFLWTYLTGLFIMGMRFVIQLSSLIKLLLKYPHTLKNGFRFIKTQDTVAPFSFFNCIVFNPDSHEQADLEMILQHEKVHAVQWHSIDLLLSTLVRALQWVNPISWFYRKSVAANLEYIADYQTAVSVGSKKEYQLALLKASSSLPVPALTNNFYQSFIKKRIIMLNKSHSKKYHQLNLLLVLPAIALFLWSFNTKEVIKYKTPENSEETSTITNNDKSQLYFSAESTNDQLNAIERYFKNNHPESLVKINNRKRSNDGKLLNFSFQVKFLGDETYATRFDRTTEAPFETMYFIEPLGNGMLLVSESGEDGVQLKISREELQIITPNGNPFPGTPQINQPEKKSPIKEDFLGENPLYIINGKEVKQSNLPKDKTLKVSGKIEVLDKEEGATKYGDKGKDGVLNLQGETTFVANTEKASSSIQTSKEIKYKITKHTTDAELNEIKAELKEAMDIDFNYAAVRNSANELTALSINYSGKEGNGSFQETDKDGINDFYFYIGDDGKSGFYSEENEERRKVREELRMERDEARNSAREIRLQNRVKEQREEMKVKRAEMAQKREELRKKRAEMRENILVANTVSRNGRTGNVMVLSDKSDQIISIDKDTSDEDLAAMKSNLASKGVTFNYKRVKRNELGEITALKITVDDGKGSVSITDLKSDDGDAIDQIIIHY